MHIQPPQLPRFQALRRVSYQLKILRDMRGQFPRECNLCGYEGRFLPTGRPPRYDAKCPRCMSVERHRLLALGNKNFDIIPTQARILHFAPEPALRAYLQELTSAYESADIVPGRASLTLDVEALEVQDDSFDVVVASHILEHVDDSRALPELLRVLRPGGRLVIFTPVVDGWAETYEHPGVATDQQRLLHYGQVDHVRYYGRDVRDRIVASGFELTEVQATPEEVIRHGLARGETAFVGTKPVASTP